MASKGPKSAKKAPIVAELKTKDGVVLSHNQSCYSSLFQIQLFGFVDAPVMCILLINDMSEIR